MSEGKPQAIIIGGGLAGLAAACELADHGCKVVLVERRSSLGGRASSFSDPQGRGEVDNGQHVFLECCTHYIRFLQKLGVSGRTVLQKRLQVTVIDPHRGASTLAGSSLPAPFHLLPSFLRFRHLSPLDKARAAYAMLSILFTDRTKNSLDCISFYRWLKDHRQSEAAIDRFWNLIVLATLNDDVRRVSADLALMVFQEGFLKRPDGANVGYATVGLTSLIDGEARRYIEERGGRVILGQKVEELLLQGKRIGGARLANGTILQGECYVCAVPHPMLLTVIPPSLRRDPFFRPASQLTTSPIVNIHLWYDRPVMALDFAAFVNSEVQWVFNKSRMWHLPGDSQYLDISLSGAWHYIGLPNEELIERFTRELRRVLPGARRARLERCLVVKQPKATFAAVPGSAAYRLPYRTPIENLFLAGDWTATGWPATMESAVRSGIACAKEMLCLTPPFAQKGGGQQIFHTLADNRSSSNLHPSSIGSKV
ncbi:MAG: hydroxysqualene dehydroxylase HpnE [Dehalococcoidia bacterium]